MVLTFAKVPHNVPFSVEYLTQVSAFYDECVFNLHKVEFLELLISDKEATYV